MCRDAGEAFRPEDTYNPVFQRFFALLRARALDPTCGVEVIEDVGKDTTVVPSAVLKRAQGPAQRFAEKFPTKPAGALPALALAPARLPADTNAPVAPIVPGRGARQAPAHVERCGGGPGLGVSCCRCGWLRRRRQAPARGRRRRGCCWR